MLLFFVKQKTAYEWRISDWSSDVGSSDLPRACVLRGTPRIPRAWRAGAARGIAPVRCAGRPRWDARPASGRGRRRALLGRCRPVEAVPHRLRPCGGWFARGLAGLRSEEHTSELQSLLRTPYAVFCFKKTKQNTEQKS